MLSTGHRPSALQGTGSGLAARPGQRETVIWSSDAAPSSMISLLASVSTTLWGNPSLIKGLYSRQGDSAARTALARHGEIQPPRRDRFPCLVFYSSRRDSISIREHWSWPGWLSSCWAAPQQLLNQGPLKQMASPVGDEHDPVSSPGPCSPAGCSAPDTSSPNCDPAKTLF